MPLILIPCHCVAVAGGAVQPATGALPAVFEKSMSAAEILRWN